MKRAPMSRLAAVLLLFPASLPVAAGEVRGRLLLNEKPVAGVTVSALPYESPFEEARRQARGGEAPRPFAQAASGADGSFRLVVPAEPGKPERLFRVALEGGGVVPVVDEDVCDASETVELPDRSLSSGRKLAGRVVDRAGQPIAGAEVTLTGGGIGPRRADMREATRTARTEADGSFRVDGVAESGTTLVVRARGFAPVRLERVRSGALARPVTLAAGETVRGVVLRSDKRTPAAGALVRADAKGASTRWVEAAADGTFTVPDAPAGKVTVEADADESGMAERRGVPLPQAEATGESGPSLRLVLVPPATLEGKVVDARTLRPVPRVKVQASAGERARLARSGPDGRYRLKALSPSEWRVAADEPRYVPLKRQGLALAAGETRRLDLALTPGATLSGRVVDENGQPIGGAKGTVDLPGPTGLAAVLRMVRANESGPAFRTAPDGTFKASRLEPGDHQKLTVAHPDYERATLGGLTLPAGGSRSGVVVTLRRGLALTGVVLDGEGQPVAGADVSVRQDRTFRAGRGGAQAVVGFMGGANDRPEVKTSGDGRFEVPGLSAGDYVVSVAKPGYATESRDGVKVGEGSQPLSITLGPSATIAGTVRYRSGGPAEGVFVVARRGGGMNLGAGGRNLEPTGPDGIFVLEGLKAGDSYDIQVLAGLPALAPAKKGVTAPAEGVDVVVTGNGRIAGTAVDAVTRRPLTEFTVSYEPDRAAGAGPVFRMAARTSGGRRTFGGAGEKTPVRSDDGAFVLEEVPAGTWSVVVEAKGYQPARVGSVVVEEGGSQEGVEVKATPGGSLKGRATDARTSRPVPNATVDVQPAGGDMGRMGPGMLMQADSDLYTDADGRFEVDTLAAGKYKVTVRHADYSEASETVDVKETGASVELRLGSGSVLGGTVLLGARSPAAGVEVTLASGGDGGGPMRLLMGGGQSTTADESGRFRFDHLAAGRYKVTATLRAESSAPQDVVLTEGETKTDVVLTIEAGAVIRGLVTGLSASELGDVRVNASGDEGWFASTRVGGDGRFQLDGAPPGTVTLRAQAGDFLGSTRSASKQITIAEGQREADAEIAFESGHTLSGSVTRGGRPVADAFVSANLRGAGGRSSSARTDESGSYRLEGLSTGSYSVSANTSAFGSMSKPTTISVDGDQTLDLTIPTARLAGVVLESGTQRPLPDATVTAESAGGGSTSGGGGGRSFRASQADSNGAFTLEDLDEATYTLTVKKPGFQFEKRDVTASDRSSDQLRFELVRGEGVGITVRDGVYGIPLRGVMARVLDAQGNAVFMGSVSLDSEGRGEVPSLKPGGYRMVVDASGYAAVELPSVNAPNANVPISLTPGGTLEIRSGPRTLEKGTASATLTSAGGRPAVLSLFETEGRLTLSTPSRRLQNVAAGAYILTCGAETRSVNVTEGGLATVDLP